MSKKVPPLDALIKLLNDEDDIARAAMVQLLKHYTFELDNILLQLQECDNELLRKRSHQLQALINFKQRRRHLGKVIKRDESEFFLSDCLFELHLLWYEKDSPTEVAELYSELYRKFPVESEVNLVNIAAFFKEQQFVALPNSTANCDLFMLGAVLDSGYGANVFFCALAQALALDLPSCSKLQVLLYQHRFFLYESATNLICDVLNHWEIRQKDFNDYTIFDSSQLLRYIGAVCFSNAVHDDAFRYVQILGEILSEKNSLKNLPYPYCGMK